MGNICVICYSFQYVFLDAEIKRSRNIGGNNLLLICHDYSNTNIKIPTLDGFSNTQEN